MGRLIPCSFSRLLTKVLSQLAVILYYDYLLTFSAEVSYIWPQPISLNILLFYLNRYIAFASKIIPLIILFSNIGYSEEVRSRWRSETTIICICHLTSFPCRGLFCTIIAIQPETEKLVDNSCNSIIRVHVYLLFLNQVAIAGAYSRWVLRDRLI